jgi:hypothetical protein
MSINELIKVNNLRETDALVLQKRFIGMVDHFVIYMGYRAEKPVFIANYKNGVKELSNDEISRYLQVLKTVRIEKFVGSNQERIDAFRRALSRVGERAYNYFSNNCEHFKNWVHFGNNYSSQVNIAGKVGLTTGGALAIAGIVSENSKVALWGAGLLLVGAILTNVSENDAKKN